MTAPLYLEPTDGRYPPRLGDLERPPSLYLLGTMATTAAVAVVGTRRCTRYGIDLAEAMGAGIARAGWSTVSGLARGIDTAAHRGCLELGGHAAAVLGSGIDVCYPPENLPVYHRILSEGGAVVSEYPAGTPPDRWRFPARNRIIAALADAVVVVEAAVRGGALITARLAAELGRPVFAVPGDVDRPASAGCNLLIRDGAIPALGAEDLVAELGLVLGAPASPGADMLPPAGSSLAEAAGHWGISLPEALARLARLELEGVVSLEDGRVSRRDAAGPPG